MSTQASTVDALLRSVQLDNKIVAALGLDPEKLPLEDIRAPNV
jgi:hypothetical protein